MAKAFVLVAKESLQSLIDKSSTKKENRPPQVLLQPLSLDGGSSEAVQKNVQELIELLPRNYKNRAKSLLKFIEPHLSIDESNQLVFKHNGRVFQGLWDLFFFLFTSDNIGRVSRPIDATDFISALIDLNIPQRLLSTKLKYVKKIMRQRAIKKKKKR